MKCEKCGSEWNSTIHTNNCPFCGELIVVDTPEIKSVEEALRIIVDERGISIFEKKTTLIGLLGDMMPTAVDERRFIKHCLSAFGTKEIVSLKEARRDEILIKQKRLSKDLQDHLYINKEKADRFVYWISYSIGATTCCDGKNETEEDLIPNTNENNEKRTKESSRTKNQTLQKKTKNANDTNHKQKSLNENSQLDKQKEEKPSTTFVGKRLDGRYEVNEIIGTGSIAAVYKAYDNIDNRTVAVKIIKDEYLTNEDSRRDFTNGMYAIHLLSHPNIVKVFDCSGGDRLQYLVMEYVEGMTLKEYIRKQGALRIRETLCFAEQILQALEYAHDKGIVHQTITTQNIMITSDKKIKVTDFLIAQFLPKGSSLTIENEINSVYYKSPEQVQGGVPDARSDLYSMGVILYEMLTGNLPTQTQRSSFSVDLKNNPDFSPRFLEISHKLEDLVMTALQKDPKERYRSASTMLWFVKRIQKSLVFIPSLELYDLLEKECEQKSNYPIRYRGGSWWQSQNRCRYCGGEFTGVFTKKCKKCGKKKDY